MNKDKFKSSVIFWLILSSVMLSKAVLSENLDIAQSPLTVKDTAAPIVMLAMSRDHQLYTKAYTDYSDLDGDGMLEPTEITYNNGVDYYGYFDSKKCYDYDNGLFNPSNDPTRGTYKHQCSSQWSGNFLNWATMTRMDIIRKVLYGGYRSTDGGHGESTVLERALIPYDAHAFVKVFSSSDMNKYTPYSDGVISICNLTNGTDSSKSATEPPLMRVASSSWPGWAASQNRQCQWRSNNNGNNGNNGNNDNNNNSDTLPPTNNNLVNPNDDDGLNVRVKVCVNNQEETNCKGYTATDEITITTKPAGLLQKYWESEKPIYFGLMTGSWENNRSGGVLRAIAQKGDNEINQTDGRFLPPVNSDFGGIIDTLNRFRINGYQFNSNKYTDDKDWGNPLSEIYLDTLRYLAGKGSALNEPQSDELGFVPSNNWNIPIETGNWCARCSIIAISAGANSFDTDGLSNNGLSIDAAAQTNTVGGSGFEEINGHSYLIGENGSDTNKSCTGKAVTNLATALGICPEAPSLQGGYQIAGLAYYARTHDFFSGDSIEVVNPNQPDEVYFEGAQSINTYSVDLAQNLPHFKVPMSSGTITFLPACEANLDYSADSSTSDWTACAMTDLKVESLNYDSDKNLVSGSFTVVWEDATSGSDFDMDGIERLEFRITSNKLEVTTTVVQTDSPKAMRFGYTIAGSNSDGVKWRVMCNEDNSCSNTSDTNPPLYDGSSAIVKLLESPLWYTAKYGGFDTIDPSVPINDQKPQNQSWDADGLGEVGHGIPDAFFKGTNPALLESALDEILNKVSSKLVSSSSVAAANSTRLDTSAAIFLAKFSPSEWTGKLVAHKINPADGSIYSTPVWDAGEKVTDQGSSARSIYTYNDVDKKGIAFTYDQLSPAQKGLLTEDELNYIRGVQLKEQPDGLFRKRTGVNRLMGDIIKSDPKFISSISQGYNALPGDEGSDYLDYLKSPAFKGRTQMLAVGANDGMLHVFNASLGTEGGKEILAYVPSTVIGKLKKLTLPTYIVNGKHQYFVDGSPNVGDAYIHVDNDSDKEWRTVLAGTLGAGGKGVFALDVTFLSPNNYATPEAFSASRVMWEINDQTAPDAADLTDNLIGTPVRYGFTNYLGLTLGQASIARMANGQFAAVFGNGYNSVRQIAVLYIVDIETGHLIRSITTGVGNASSGLPT